MIFDVILRSLKAPRRLVTVDELLGRAEGSRMPQIDAAKLTAGMARQACDICPTAALAMAKPQETELLALDYGKCIGCGRCMELVAFSPAERLTNCGVSKKELVRYFDCERATEVEIGPNAPEVRKEIFQLLGRALNIRELDTGSCNGCEAEIAALTNPYYDLERFGIHFVASPKHADMLLVTGPVTRNMAVAVKKTYEAMPAPGLVVAVGACGCSGGIFASSYAVAGPLDNLIPVDAYIPGCPPTPALLLTGILEVLQRTTRHEARHS
jgi:Ni,Fe-hydrogenase III small subunit